MDRKRLVLQTRKNQGLFWKGLNSLPDDKMQPFADNKLYAIEIMISVYDGVENIVGKGENSGYQHYFIIWEQCNPFSLMVNSF